jgi:hypothetical protein
MRWFLSEKPACFSDKNKLASVQPNDENLPNLREQRSGWSAVCQGVRELPTSVLAAFGWFDVRVKRAVEIRPGLWFGQMSEC